MHQNIYLPLLHRPTFERGLAEGLHLRFVVLFIRKSPDGWDLFNWCCWVRSCGIADDVFCFVFVCAGMMALRRQSWSCARLGHGGAWIPGRLPQVLHAAGSCSTRWSKLFTDLSTFGGRSYADASCEPKVPQVERHLFGQTKLYDLQYCYVCHFSFISLSRPLYVLVSFRAFADSRITAGSDVPRGLLLSAGVQDARWYRPPACAGLQSAILFVAP
jgi:hypothetical protein